MNVHAINIHLAECIVAGSWKFLRYEVHFYFYLLFFMGYIIGVDIGTSNTKAVAFGISGEILSNASVSYGAIHSAPDLMNRTQKYFLCRY